jgi:hypothetical protein
MQEHIASPGDGASTAMTAGSPAGAVIVLAAAAYCALV